MVDNVKVAIRLRPLNARELREGGRRCVTAHAEHQALTLEARPDPKVFTYDYVAEDHVSQAEFFETVGQPITDSCLSGYNCTVFAYGQTGAGKTYTIQGNDPVLVGKASPSNERGLLPRCFEYLFTAMEQDVGSEYLIRCSYLEIYQEQVKDLLGPNGTNLQLREDMKHGVYVDGLIEEPVDTLQETYELLRIGMENRHVGSTSMNIESSRSHSVFTLVIESKHQIEGLTNFKCSHFHLIDLAGSERQRATDAAGDRLKEAGMINKSLSALGNVINSLVDLSEGKSRHVHYRDSKLTFLLKDSLGGNSKTCIVANISPSATSFAETLSTLKFASRAKKIKNKAIVNEDTTGTVQLLRNQIKRLKDELLALKAGTGCATSTTVDVNSIELELLLEHNIRLRQEAERYMEAQLLEKEKVIESLKVSLSKYSRMSANDKMVIKFRDATIAKYKGTASLTSEEVQLQKENAALREQLESNPVAARLFAQNKLLSCEAETLRKELGEEPGSLRWRLKESTEFIERLTELLETRNPGTLAEQEELLQAREEARRADQKVLSEASLLQAEASSKHKALVRVYLARQRRNTVGVQASCSLTLQSSVGVVEVSPGICRKEAHLNRQLAETQEELNALLTEKESTDELLKNLTLTLSSARSEIAMWKQANNDKIHELESLQQALHIEREKLAELLKRQALRSDKAQSTCPDLSLEHHHSVCFSAKYADSSTEPPLLSNTQNRIKEVAVKRRLANLRASGSIRPGELLSPSSGKRF